MNELAYDVDVRYIDPGVTRKGQFTAGWNAAVRGRVYSEKALRQLTWNDLGYRLGRLFGEASPELRDELFDWCRRQHQDSAIE